MKQKLPAEQAVTRMGRSLPARVQEAARRAGGRRPGGPPGALPERDHQVVRERLRRFREWAPRGPGAPLGYPDRP